MEGEFGGNWREAKLIKTGYIYIYIAELKFQAFHNFYPACIRDSCVGFKPI